MKKVLSIVLSIAMVVCLMPSMAFAATDTAKASITYSDIPGEKCEGAVNVLSALSIVNGYEDGTYKPAQTVTRAEMAKLIITALGLADYASATTSQFTDMTGATWAIPYVEYAASLNIVNGYGGGKFGPNDTVTYEQALTMVVRALGYTDEAKEMNGTWPAVYVQKARALGLLEDVDNGGATGANRGDVAIIIYNALTVNQVYVDNDGATQNKKGTNGASTTTMMDTLNQGGTSEYSILTDTDADDALYNIRSYVGAAGKIIKNKDGKVLALGDVKTVFLTGDYDYAEKEFEADDVTYTLKDDAFKTISANGTISTLSDVAKTGITSFANGKSASKLTPGAIGDDVTIACKVSGKTITEVYSVATWSGEKYYTVKAADLTNIKNNHKFQGYEFPENDNGDIDYTAFVLEGIDSLDDIAADNIAKLYISGTKDITKFSVGTRVVEGTVTKLVTGNENTKWEITIDGTKYKAVSKGANAVKGITSDTVSVNDSVKLYLTANGKIAKIEKVEGTSDYAVVIDLGVEDKDGAFTTAKDKIYKIRLLTADGSKKDYVVDDDYVDDLADGKKGDAGKKLISDKTKGWYTGEGALTSGAIIKYSVASDGEIDSITKQTVVTGKSGKISKTGYYNGLKIADDATIFTCDTDGSTFDSSEKDDWSTTDRASILDSDETVAKYVLKDSKIVTMIIQKDLSGSDYTYGVYIDQSSIKDGDYKYEVTMLVDGKTVTYKSEKDCGLDTMTVYKFKLGSDGELDSKKITEVSDTLGALAGSDNGITLENNAVSKQGDLTKSIAYDDDVVVYIWDGKNNEYKLGDLSDVENADSETFVSLYDAGSDDGDDDQVASLIIVDTKDAVQGRAKAAARFAAAKLAEGSIWTKEDTQSAANKAAVDKAQALMTGIYKDIKVSGSSNTKKDETTGKYTAELTFALQKFPTKTATSAAIVGCDSVDPVVGEVTETEDGLTTFSAIVTEENGWTLDKTKISVTAKTSDKAVTVASITTEAGVSGTAIKIVLEKALDTAGQKLVIGAGTVTDESGRTNAEVAFELDSEGPKVAGTPVHPVGNIGIKTWTVEISDKSTWTITSDAISQIQTGPGLDNNKITSVYAIGTTGMAIEMDKAMTSSTDGTITLPAFFFTDKYGNGSAETVLKLDMTPAKIWVSPTTKASDTTYGKNANLRLTFSENKSAADTGTFYYIVDASSAVMTEGAIYASSSAKTWYMDKSSQLDCGEVQTEFGISEITTSHYAHVTFVDAAGNLSGPVNKQFAAVTDKSGNWASSAAITLS